jgi:hypothetical protein
MSSLKLPRELMEAIWVEKGEYAGVWIEHRPPNWRRTDDVQLSVRVAWQVLPEKYHLAYPLGPSAEATPDQWKFLTGLVVCGLATKVNV